jgi:hypothetical protein
MTKQKELLERRQEHEGEKEQDWKAELTQNTQGFTFDDLQRGILNFVSIQLCRYRVL